MIKIIVSGALGRMGKRITFLADKDSDLEVVGGVDLEEKADLKVVKNLKDIKGDYDCIIEFTLPEATLKHVEEAKSLKKPIVIGTTGLSEDEQKLIKKASKEIPIVFSPNMSIGVNVFFSLIERSAKILGLSYKPSIKEAHHIHKKDKPSGTAKLMAKLVKDNSGVSEVPIEAIREDEIVGDHDIVFESEVDTLKISHSAKTRDIFALGALKAAKFLSGKKNGLFSMADVLGLKEK